MAYEDAWNSTSIELVAAAEVHGRTIIVDIFYNTVNVLQRKVSPELGLVLQQLLQLYAVNTALRCSGDFLRVSTIMKNPFTKRESFDLISKQAGLLNK